ncbi:MULTISPECIES: hypothetical protein [unclassified Rathayibacter]|uniref:hypothetical protein n=1 Tax=unclassified Rathayibacter TaxID=2609250 RepID=UPI00188C27B2|nr:MULTISPECIES: hypothetical protein [unclassified Rathayibacter]MBF4463455.1 hypothetical protein [Rathayibacter sp. VKM Ac-2879]MBF4504822.1 hypothetical protein [Rathayibacter sp. VKM Ac-2878]
MSIFVHREDLFAVVDLAWELDDILDDWCHAVADQMRAGGLEVPDWLVERLGEADAREPRSD